MLPNDIQYYGERAATERERARNAANPDIAEIHEELARQYEAMIKHPELRGVLRAAS